MWDSFHSLFFWSSLGVRPVTEQFPSSFRAVSERFPIISGQFQNRIKFHCLMNSGQFPSNSFGWCQCSFRSTPEQFSSRFRSISNRLQVNSRAVYEQLFKENFTQFSGPFQSNSRSILEHFTSDCRSVSEQFLKANFTQFSSPFQSNSKPTPEQFLSVFQWVSEQFQSNFQTFERFPMNSGAISEQFSDNSFPIFAISFKVNRKKNPTESKITSKPRISIINRR